MNNLGYIEFKVSGKKGILKITPENIDIREIIEVLQAAEDLLFPNEKKNRPIISYQLEKGSVRHIFKTPIQYVIQFNALLSVMVSSNSIDSFDEPTQKAFETLQSLSQKNNYNIEVKTSLKETEIVNITPQTEFIEKESSWVNAEFYFYGEIVNIGGKSKSTIHLDTEDYGLITIQTPKEIIEKIESNPLYKKFGIRVSGFQNKHTGVIDKNTLSYLAIVDYKPVYDEKYINTLISRAEKNWKDIEDPDLWLREMRGYYA
jgi:hypothetical protein